MSIYRDEDDRDAEDTISLTDSFTVLLLMVFRMTFCGYQTIDRVRSLPTTNFSYHQSEQKLRNESKKC